MQKWEELAYERKEGIAEGISKGIASSILELLEMQQTPPVKPTAPVLLCIVYRVSTYEIALKLYFE